MKKTRIILAGALALCAMGCREAADFAPVNLKAEHMTDPSVLDTGAPRLSWVNEPTSERVRGAEQKSYRIVASTSLDKLLSGDYDLWDSGEVESAASYLVPYSGKAPAAGGDCYWMVSVTDSKGLSEGWSEPGHWGVGLPDSVWTSAEWIGAPWQGEEPRKLSGADATPAPLLRKAFELKGEVKKAKAFVSGLGFFELYVNGDKVGDDVLVPNLTNYTKRKDLDRYPIVIDDKFRDYRVMYLAYDVTDMLRDGENAIGAVVGNGFYDVLWAGDSPFGTPRFICRLEIEYADGTRDSVVSDGSWKACQSAIRVDSPFEGEIYDANYESDGWSTASFDDSGWEQAVLRNRPDGRMCAHAAPTDKVTGRYAPVSLDRGDDGVWTVRFPEEISGWIRLKGVDASAGDTINVSYVSESPNQGVQRYIAGRDGKVDYAPRFTWFVFSEAKIAGVDDLRPENLVAEAVNTEARSVGEFRSSVGLLDSINTIWRRSQLDNMHGGIASDCPHRERAPYTGDGQVAMNTVMSNFDVAAFYRKWLRDMRDAQNVETGYVPNGAPWQPTCGGGVAWGAAMNIMPWEYFVQYGDRAVLAENYDAMKEQVRYMHTWKTPEGTMHSQKPTDNNPGGEPMYWLNLGDWCVPYELPSQELVHSYFYWLCIENTGKAASVLGHDDEAAQYAAMADDVRKAVIDKFYDSDKGTFGGFGSNVFALEMGMPDSIAGRVGDALAREVMEVHGGHLHTGIFATRHLFEQLASMGHNDVAMTAMMKRDYPSYGLWLANGATTTWEQWDCGNSHNHPMFGGGLMWLYNRLAGVEPIAGSPGFKRFRVRPVPWGEDGMAAYEYESPYGLIKSEIGYDGSKSTLNVTVPVGAVAEVWLPVLSGSKGEAGGDAASWKRSADGDYLVTEVGQGTYTFMAE